MRKFKDRELPFINNILDNYTRHAQDRGLVFSLSKEEFKELVKKPCFYCGTENSNTWTNRRTGEIFLHNGIDRVDSSKGYIWGNCVPCCKECNRSKSDKSVEDFIDHARRIVSYQEGKI